MQALLPAMSGEWHVRVVPGPHGAPDYLTDAASMSSSAASGRSTTAPTAPASGSSDPRRASPATDGGEAGLHPSNIHDSAYPVGGMMLSGGTPVVVGPDGPSLGGFVVPAVVVQADRWMFAQARPGDTVRLVPVSPEQAEDANDERAQLLLGRRVSQTPSTTARRVVPAPAVGRGRRLGGLPRARRTTGRRPPRPGRGRAAACSISPYGCGCTCWPWPSASVSWTGSLDLVEGVRSVLIGVDETVLPLKSWRTRWSRPGHPPSLEEVELPVREVVLPIALDDPLVHEAMIRYQTSVRPDAPWCPDNVEFIRRVNGLATRDEVFEIVAAARYLVVGLGDVYLGAPVAVPLDPRHRLVTTKYDPARTWTPANAVGIGGIYLCVYGMEGPGGYQLLGRTVPVWRYDATRDEPPWLLRMFDRLRFKPVLRRRAGPGAGRHRGRHAQLETPAGDPAAVRPAERRPRRGDDGVHRAAPGRRSPRNGRAGLRQRRAKERAVTDQPMWIQRARRRTRSPR